MADPIRRQVNPAAVSAELDLFLKHLFAEDFKLDHLVSSLGKVFRIARLCGPGVFCGCVFFHRLFYLPEWQLLL